MSEKFIVVQGAECKCQYGSTTDKLKVLSHEKEYANDRSGSEKLVVTTMEIGGATFENNTFGECSVTDNACKITVSEWQDYYEEVVLSNGGYIVLETSKAVCPVGGGPCIEIVDHGQVTEASKQNFENTDREVHNQLNPLADVKDLTRREHDAAGVTFGS